MPEPAANQARYFFESSGLEDDTFSVASFRGTEHISECFRFEIELISDDPDIPYDDVVNKRAKFEIVRLGDKVPINGIISEFKQGPKIQEYYQYTAVLVPSLWRLKLNHKSRIFQKESVDKIIENILVDNGLAPADFKFDLKRKLPKREYCVQYQESDFDFICRLMEHEGIYFFFQFDGERDLLVITDDRQAHEPIEGEDVVVYHEGAGLVAELEDVIYLLDVNEQIVTGKVVLNDYNYRTPDVSLQVDSQLNNEMPGQRYEYGDHYADTKEGKELAKLRNQEIECQRRVIRGESVCMGFRSGFLFTLDKHFRRDLNDEEYLLLGIRHSGSQEKALAMELGFQMSPEEMSSEDESLYRNEFTCIPASVQFRPERRTPKPRVSGIMTGMVESTGGDYPYLDDAGRYHARMHFDPGNPASGEGTHPIRMAQPHSGPNYGIHFPHHARTEMVWACIDGDVDRPIIIGTVPNPNNKSPSLDKNRVENVIRTKAGNQVVMDDTIDKARILINTPDANRMVFNDMDDHIVIETTKKHRVTLDDKNKRIEVKTTNGHFILMQDGDSAEEGKITVQSEVGHRISINDKDKLITLVDESGDNIFQIDIGNKQLTIKTEEGGIELLAENGVIDIKAKTLNIETSGDTNVQADNFKLTADTNVEAEAGAALTLEAGTDIDMKAGANLKSEAGVNHDIKGTMVKSEASLTNDVAGAMINVKASALNTITGVPVKIN